MLILRIALVVIAAIEIYWFSDSYGLAFGTLTHPFEARWFDVASALASGMIAPLTAIAAAGLAVAGKRLGLAAILLGVAPVVYLLPVIAFFIAIMIYGF